MHGMHLRVCHAVEKSPNPFKLATFTMVQHTQKSTENQKNRKVIKCKNGKKLQLYNIIDKVTFNAYFFLNRAGLTN